MSTALFTDHSPQSSQINSRTLTEMYCLISETGCMLRDMSTQRTLTAMALGAVLVFVPVLGRSQSSSPSQDDGVKHDVKAAGTETKDAAKDAGHDVKQGTTKGAQATENGARKATHATAQGTTTAAHATADGTKKAANATAQGTTTAAHATANETKKLWEKTKSTTTGAVHGAKEGAEKKTD
jgi:hypothetical protein